MVISTPGRFLDCVERGFLTSGKEVYLVVDEADKMVCNSSDLNIKKLFLNLFRTEVYGARNPAGSSNLIPEQSKSVYLITATLPLDVKKFINLLGYVFTTVIVDDVEGVCKRVEHRVRFVSSHDKYCFLVEELNMKRFCRTMIFCRNGREVEELYMRLESDGFGVGILHGGMTLQRRMANIQKFKKGEKGILIATDLVSRGVDISGVKFIINYDVPDDILVYIHRSGRTGRAGLGGSVLSLVRHSEQFFLAGLRGFFEKNRLRIPLGLA